MFEHFGIMDILAAFRRYILIISIVVLGSTLIFGLRGMSKVKEIFSNSHTTISNDMCISTSSYYIDPITNDDTINNESMNYFRAIPDDFEAFLNSDSCLEYIYDRITNIYGKDHIIKNSTIGLDEQAIKPDDFNILSIKKLFTAERFENTMVVNISSYSYDEKLSDDILSACEDYINLSVLPNFNKVSIKYTGNSKKTLSPAQLSEFFKKSDNQITNSTTNTNVNHTKAIIVALIKNVAVPVFLVFVLCLMVLFIIALFNPTLNRKSDFSEYDIPVIGEIRNKTSLKEMK